jgi:hypothetical protein
MDQEKLTIRILYSAVRDKALTGGLDSKVVREAGAGLYALSEALKTNCGFTSDLKDEHFALLAECIGVDNSQEAKNKYEIIERLLALHAAEDFINEHNDMSFSKISVARSLLGTSLGVSLFKNIRVYEEQDMRSFSAIGKRLFGYTLVTPHKLMALIQDEIAILRQRFGPERSDFDFRKYIGVHPPQA